MPLINNDMQYLYQTRDIFFSFFSFFFLFLIFIQLKFGITSFRLFKMRQPSPYSDFSTWRINKSKTKSRMKCLCHKPAPKLCAPFLASFSPTSLKIICHRAEWCCFEWWWELCPCLPPSADSAPAVYGCPFQDVKTGRHLYSPVKSETHLSFVLSQNLFLFVQVYQGCQQYNTGGEHLNLTKKGFAHRFDKYTVSFWKSLWIVTDLSGQ